MVDEGYHRRKQNQDQSFVCAVADALRQGDEVLLNDRSRPLTVMYREQDTGGGLTSGSDYPYHHVWLEGNGTTYRMRYSHTGNSYPMLHTDSQLRTVESRAPHRPDVVVQADGTSKTVLTVSVVGVDDGALAAWALQRNIDLNDGTDSAMEVDDGV